MDITDKLLEKCIEKYESDRIESRCNEFPEELLILVSDVTEESFETMKWGMDTEAVKQKILYKNKSIKKVPSDFDIEFIRNHDRFWSRSYGAVGHCGDKAFIMVVNGPRWGYGFEYLIESGELIHEHQIWIS